MLKNDKNNEHVSTAHKPDTHDLIKTIFIVRKISIQLTKSNTIWRLD